ncbi:acetyltransferase [Mycobacterium sp. IS-1742]|uniref:GNAT family N-acetyltransferase n=1 Tax=Mycobacterium sp. IS-1742 TaxID=1772285 RepID=UPI0007403BCC|nr:GNAT family N-acetyltransferase [Mycobacterium sp. IS-1742]KUI24176.1 acetyltransferase [Mycobacterium sp. IS-1742]
MEHLGPQIFPATHADLPELADVAARTFPLACPESVTAENIAAFVAENLSQHRFADYLTDPDRVVLAARTDGRMVGYAMLIRGVPDDDDVQRAVSPRPAIEVSKMYVLPDSHGSGASSALMDEALTLARRTGYRCVWLGVNQENRRAQRFYAKHGFAVTGTKTFRLGAGVENDFVMVCPLGNA